MRVVYLMSFLCWLLAQIVRRASREMVLTFHPRRPQQPAIYAVPLRSRTDLAVTIVTASIAVTPGSQVLGIAPAVDGSPIIIYVHALDASRQQLQADVADIERRLLRGLGPRVTS